MAVLLIDEKSGARINLGDATQALRGEVVAVRGCEAPHWRSSSGRVYVDFEDGHTASYYPSSIKAKADDQ